MIRLIACDLDETLLNDEKNVSLKNYEAIKQFERQGGIFVPCTGRLYTGLKRTLTQLDAWQQAGHYVISTNGALISENTGKVLYSNGVDIEKAFALIAYGREHGIGMEVFTGSGVLYYENLDAKEERDLPLFIEGAKPLPQDYSFLKGQVIPKMLYERQDMAYLQSFAKQMPQALKEDLEISFSSDRYIELNKAGVHKGSGLAILAELLGVTMEEIMAIGDNYNDVGMLKTAGFSVAVANAPADIQQLCDHVCIHTYQEDAVAEAIAYVLSNQI